MVCILLCFDRVGFIWNKLLSSLGEDLRILSKVCKSYLSPRKLYWFIFKENRYIIFQIFTATGISLSLTSESQMTNPPLRFPWLLSIPDGSDRIRNSAKCRVCNEITIEQSWLATIHVWFLVMFWINYFEKYLQQ